MWRSQASFRSFKNTRTHFFFFFSNKFAHDNLVEMVKKKIKKMRTQKKTTHCIWAAAASQDEQRLIINHDLNRSKSNRIISCFLSCVKVTQRLRFRVASFVRRQANGQQCDLFSLTCDWPPRGWGEGPAMGGLDQDHCSRSRTQTSLLLKQENKTVT